MRKPRSNRAFLNDILTAIDDIETDVRGVNFEIFTQTRQLQKVVLFNLQIIGEAANRLEDGLRARYPQVPWSKAIGMRKEIVHGYFAIDEKTIWKTITESLPPLKAQIAAILADMERLTDDEQ